MYDVEHVNLYRTWTNETMMLQIQKSGASSYRVVIFKINDDLEYVITANYNLQKLLSLLKRLNLTPSTKKLSLK